MDIGILRLGTITQVIADVVDLGILRPATILLIIVENMLIEVDLGHQIPANITLTIRDQELMLKREA